MTDRFWRAVQIAANHVVRFAINRRLRGKEQRG